MAKRKTSVKADTADGNAKTKTKSKPKKKAASTAQPLTAAFDESQIAARAYDLWLEKGQPTGQDEQTWQQAESELLATAR